MIIVFFALMILAMYAVAFTIYLTLCLALGLFRLATLLIGWTFHERSKV